MGADARDLDRRVERHAARARRAGSRASSTGASPTAPESVMSSGDAPRVRARARAHVTLVRRIVRLPDAAARRGHRPRLVGTEPHQRLFARLRRARRRAFRATTTPTRDRRSRLRPRSPPRRGCRPRARGLLGAHPTGSCARARARRGRASRRVHAAVVARPTVDQALVIDAREEPGPRPAREHLQAPRAVVARRGPGPAVDRVDGAAVEARGRRHVLRPFEAALRS